MKVLIITVISLIALWLVCMRLFAVRIFKMDYDYIKGLIDACYVSKHNHDVIKELLDELIPRNADQEDQKRHLYLKFRFKFGEY